METEEAAIRIPLENVQSSALSAIGYDRDKRILAVRFKSGAVHHYSGVPESEMIALYTAPSLGSHFAFNIKSKYESARMTGSCPSCGAKHGYLGDTCSDCGTATYVDERKSNG